MQINKTCRLTSDSAQNSRGTKRLSAFSLIEATVSVALFSMVAAGVFATVTQSVSEIGAIQENMRATQIIQDQMEGIRLYTWEQINSNGFISTTFSAPYYPTNSAGATANTFNYTGTITIANVAMTENYAADHKAVTVKVNWTREGVSHSRSVTTLVSHYGLHNYYYHSY
jgi:type II secretory pathway pseudopilin PulG